MVEKLCSFLFFLSYTSWLSLFCFVFAVLGTKPSVLLGKGSTIELYSQTPKSETFRVPV